MELDTNWDTLMRLGHERPEDVMRDRMTGWICETADDFYRNNNTP